MQGEAGAAVRAAHVLYKGERLCYAGNEVRLRGVLTMAQIQIRRGEEGRIKVLLPYDPELIKLLGHKSPKTTEIYTHVSKRDIGRIQNPLDSLVVQRKGEDDEGP